MNKKLLKWAGYIPFTIDKGLVRVDNLNKFMDELDSQFKDWEDNEDTMDGKI